MEKIIKNGSKLKTGYTTGTCAQAAAKAAAVYLFTDKKFDYVEVNILSGKLLKIRYYEAFRKFFDIQSLNF